MQNLKYFKPVLEETILILNNLCGWIEAEEVHYDIDYQSTIDYQAFVIK